MADDEVVKNLLGGIPTGEEIRDPREGEHPNATVGGVDTAEQGNGWVVKVTYNGLVDTDGRQFEYTERYNIPTSNSEDWVHRMFLAICHDLQIVPRSFKSRILADTEADREVVKGAFSKSIGNSVPLRITMDSKSGYLRSRVLRVKKAA